MKRNNPNPCFFVRILAVAACSLIFSISAFAQQTELAETTKNINSFGSTDTKAVTEIDLSNSNLASVPATIFELTSLETLDLRNNPLQFLPRDIRKLQSLRVLNLSGTNIEELPEEISQLRHLQEIHLNYEQWQYRLDDVKRITRARIFLD